MLLHQVKRTIDRDILLQKGDRLIIGVSGGVDSMVLLHLLNSCRQEFSLSLIVAHVNHGLRPDESEREEQLVREESGRLGLPFEYEKFDLREFRRARKLSLQDAGRRMRFRFFRSLLLKHQAQKIALGHNADDQVETVVLRLMRGAGLKGLKGMLPIREGKVIRPLLDVWRGEIESYAEKNDIPFLQDSSNLKKDYLRNRVRLSLIPVIEREYQSNFKTVVLKASRVLREENDYLEREGGEAYQRIIQEEKGGVSFRFSEYQRLHKAIQWRLSQKVMEKIYDKRMDPEGEEGFDAGLIYRKLSEPSPSFRFELDYGICFEKRYDRITLTKERINPVPPFDVDLASPGRTPIDEIGREVIIEEAGKNSQPELNGSPETALLDYQSLTFPLKMRNFRPGDRFQPLGTKGTQKLKEFFIDHKVPRFERPKVPLLISGEIIAWVGGYRIDDRVKITDRTQRILRVALR